MRNRNCSPGDFGVGNRSAERGEHVLLDGSLERSGAEVGCEPLLDQERDRAFVELDRPGPVTHAAAHDNVVDLLVEERAHLLPIEWSEHDYAVDAVQELGPERPLQSALDVCSSERLDVAGEAKARPGLECRSHVRRHDQQTPAKVSRAPISVG